jgi:hypothetical protein
MSFETNIQNWVTLDNKIKLMNNELNELRNNRKDLGTHILQYVTEERLDSATVNITDGSIKFVNTKNLTPLTYRYLYKSLTDFFKDEKIAAEFILYIKEKRESQYNLDIKRYYVNAEEY